MSKLKQTKIPVTLDNDGTLRVGGVATDLQELLTEEAPNWKLVRERDGLTKQSVKITWIEWNEDGRFKAMHDEPAIGRSLLMGPFNAFFTWQTTTVTEIVEQREDYIQFRTQNSNYELSRI
jgi:hypothetical protein